MRIMNLILIGATVVLTSCATNQPRNFDEKTVAGQISEAQDNTIFPDINFDKPNKKSNITVIDDNFFAVDEFDISLKGLLQEEVKVNFYNRDVNELVSDLPRILDMPIDIDRSSFYDAGGKLRFSNQDKAAEGEGDDKKESQEPRFSLSYKGTKEGFLNHLCFKTGCGWWIEKGEIKMARLMKKTWDIPLLSGQQDIDAQLSNTASSGGAGGAEGTSINGSGGQSISSKMNLDVFKSIRESVQQMMSPDGKLSLSESFGILTVSDQRNVIETIDDFVVNVIEKMSIQVTFDVRILTVEKTNTDNRGINWSLINDNLGDFGIGASVSSLVPGDASSLSIAVLDGGDDWFGSEAIIQSLSSQVDVIRENKYGGTTLNHTPLPIQVSRDTPFVEFTTTPVENSNGLVRQEIEVNNETVGLSMSLLPVVRDEDSLLVHFNLTDSSLVETRTFDFGPNGSAEVPVKDARNFIQRAILKSGQSLVLSGFSQDIDRNTASSPFHHKAWAPFGSRNKTGQQTDLMIIITPRIIREI